MQAPHGGQPFAAAEEGVPPEPQPEPQPQPLAASSTAAGAVPMGDDEFPDEALVLVCSFVDLRQLGRLACVSRRFTEPTLTEPGSGAKLSAIEEGARLQFMSGADGSPAAAQRLEGETWMRALWRTQYCLHVDKDGRTYHPGVRERLGKCTGSCCTCLSPCAGRCGSNDGSRDAVCYGQCKWTCCGKRGRMTGWPGCKRTQPLSFGQVASTSRPRSVGNTYEVHQ